jgi:hypothetical protein
MNMLICLPHILMSELNDELSTVEGGDMVEGVDSQIEMQEVPAEMVIAIETAIAEIAAEEAEAAAALVPETADQMAA